MSLAVNQRNRSRFAFGFTALLVVTAMLVVSPQVRAQGEAPPGLVAADGVAESLLLLQHLLRTAVSPGETEARYAACARARGVYDGLQLRLTPAQRQTWNGRLRTAFSRLPLPESVAVAEGPRFHRVKGAKGISYVSEAIVISDYARFLTTRVIAVDQVRSQFYQVPFLQGAGATVTGADAEAPVSGLSWHAADAYRQWLATRLGVTVRLPRAVELPPGLRRSLWVSDRYVEQDPQRAELLRSYGGVPAALLLAGEAVGEFPEATLPGVQLHVAIGVDEARRLYLAKVQEATP